MVILLKILYGKWRKDLYWHSSLKLLNLPHNNNKMQIKTSPTKDTWVAQLVKQLP